MWEIYDAYIKPSLKALLSVWQQPNGEWSVSFFNQRQKILLMMLYTNRISDANERRKAFFIICNVCFLLYAEIDRWNVWTDYVTKFFLSYKYWGKVSYNITFLFILHLLEILNCTFDTFCRVNIVHWGCVRHFIHFYIYVENLT